MRRLIVWLLWVGMSWGLRAQTAPPTVLFALERTTCYGNCPYYSVEIYDDGTARYHGKRHVERLGIYTASVPATVVARLKAKAKAINYLALYPKYPTEGLGIIDLPLCISRVQLDGVPKTIYNRNDAPVGLVQYEQLFDDLVEDLVWKPVQ